MEKNTISCEFVPNLQRFRKISPEFETFTDDFNLSALSPDDIRKVLLKLANFLFNRQYVMQLAECFKQDLPAILVLALNFDDVSRKGDETYLKNCMLLARIIAVHPDVKRFVLEYFKTNPPPFMIELDEHGAKGNWNVLANIFDADVAEACYRFLRHCPEYFRHSWPWSEFIQKYFDHSDSMVKWYCCQCISIITGMNELQLRTLLSHTLTTKTARQYDVERDAKLLELSDHDFCLDEISNETTFNDVYLPIYVAQSVTIQPNVLEVGSTCNNLRKICLGIASNKAVGLEGPVGSGKTTLVEYLAGKTGRVLGESFVKIQLGDQTDSKMLLGTYRCTDIPGEFVWQPGVLTQAVMDGSWLLLEDIDSASVDIASVLSGLLENGYLTVPGYRDVVPVTPGFQLFVTQRLISTMTGYHKRHTNASTLLEKQVLQVSVDPLTPKELQQIIEAAYPVLKTVCARMVGVFLIFADGSVKAANMPKSGRLISTRDLFKWCSRAAVDFDVSSQGSALKVLQDAIDIFCCSHANLDERLSLAREISTHLGIVNEKANYFCNQHKPNVSLTVDALSAGRTSLKRRNAFGNRHLRFCFTRPAACLLERIACCVRSAEPVLLVGETGTGKTSAVQYLAHSVGQKLVVINMNQQSDSADLLGGFKPVDLKFVIAPVRKDFESVFRAYFDVERNQQFLRNVSYCYNEGRHNDLLKLMKKSYQAAMTRLTSAVENKPSKLGGKRTRQAEVVNQSKLRKDLEFLTLWKGVGNKLQKLEAQLRQKNALAFAFIEGSLIKAVENGYWVLLDEINLANAETLECLSGLLEGPQSSLSLLERGDKQPVSRHQNFTLFACMNPSTDVGKKDLPAGLRNRFTEFFVDELTEKTDLLLLVNSYLEAKSLSHEKLESIVKLYVGVRKEALLSLSDGLGHKPHFSLRSLCRALAIASKNPCGSFVRSLYEAFCLSFLTQLDLNSYKRVETMIVKHIVGSAGELNAILKQPMPLPRVANPDKYLQFEGYWIHKGELEPAVPEEYVLTASVRRNLKDLARVVSIGHLPVLLQGDTAIGKTSLIVYLAKSSGNKCVRINNHEHTDLQEYIGSYVADPSGKLIFREGLLVEAMRKGHWIILDELNLAPTDVLEALNRVLDDNRELFIPETQETVSADPNFMLFATQNPPGAYGGRKMLSRAFRNRFVELHFDEIPHDELEFILYRRCEMAPSYAKKMIGAMKELQTRRRGSAAFAGKHGFITLRDLFRWGERYRLAGNKAGLYDWDQHLADEGYLVLAGRVRRSEEREEIREVIKKHMKRQVLPQNLFTLSEQTSAVTRGILEGIESKKEQHNNIAWTYSMRQLAVLVSKAFQFREPVLLVGDTGGGKTTICKLLAESNGQELVTLNCHMHTESADFIGGLRPVRTHKDDDLNRLFEWVDGPLIRAMVRGNVFLADEISLADDSVLERLNSLLEPERSLLLAEKGVDVDDGENSEVVVADAGFRFVGTMNPGGDFGKKELSPALRNRFTEIWCEPCGDPRDLVDIVEHNVRPGVCLGNGEGGASGVGKGIVDFVEWFKRTEIGKRFTISIRDILTWVHFINFCSNNMEPSVAFVHGACLTFLDSLGSGATGTESRTVLEKFRNDCVRFLSRQVEAPDLHLFDLLPQNVLVSQARFGIKPFYIDMGEFETGHCKFSFDAPTTVYNTLRLLRGMQLNKAILLEGSPGVGKTSLITALAASTRNKIFRVNLSDQTDISDLFGADLPVEGGRAGQFSWRDGPLLQALKQGHWILLDELNLASQSVLEGLNACLDHRGEIFIPELGKVFHVKAGTRFFACQNPTKQGGSRRGLPKSFLNRFTQVYVSPLQNEDLWHILKQQFPMLPKALLKQMIDYNGKLVDEVERQAFGHKGGPWEYNLRDLTRWCGATVYHYDCKACDNKKYSPENLVGLIYSDRLRCLADKQYASRIFEHVFGKKVGGEAVIAYVTRTDAYIGDALLKRETSGFNSSVAKQEETCLVLRSQLSVLRSLVYCVNLNWMSILVGSAGCGKTSAVRTLAQVTGKNLHTLPVTSAMDTTDLLGGFEQTDYTRHVEEITRQMERLLYETAQDLLVLGKSARATELLGTWEKCTQIFRRVTQNKTLTEETELFLEKLEILTVVLNALNDCDCRAKDLISSLLQRIRTIARSVREEGCLNAGGRFEWVDSILIKCLVNGWWLLVDNVNLCSPAVLDRLNALLEPNGTLTIGERGIDEDGKMVEIKPHKDFRLFLTMDPRNGEISRAMRNRGVEIYMLNEKESASRNVYDMKSLISHKGLTSHRMIALLIQMHDFVSELILGEKPSVSHILQASFLISQQLSRGIGVRFAFLDALIDVYYKTRAAHDFITNDALTVIETELNRLLNSDSAGDELDFYDYDGTLKSMSFQNNSDLSRIKQHMAILHRHLQLRAGNNAELYHQMIQDLLMHFYSITSREDLETRYMYLQKYVRDKGNDIDEVICALTSLCSKASALDLRNDLPIDKRWLCYTSAETLNSLKVCNEVLLMLYVDIRDVNVELYGHLNEDLTAVGKNLPADRRWLPDVTYDKENLLQCNKKLLLMHFVSYKLLNEMLESVENLKGKTKLTLLQYMLGVSDKQIQPSIDDPVVKDFLDLLNKFDSFFADLLKRYSVELEDDETVEVMSLLRWRFVLYRVTKVGVVSTGKSSQLGDVLSKLHLHYKWFVKYSVARLQNFLKINEECDVNRIVNRINANLPNHFDVLRKIGRRYRKNIKGPPPLIDANQIGLLAEYNQIAQYFDLYARGNDLNRVLSCYFHCGDLLPLLVDVKVGLSYDFTEVSESFLQLRQVHARNECVAIVDRRKRTEVCVLPIADYFVLLTMYKTRLDFGGGDFMNVVTVPASLQGVVKRFEQTRDDRLKHEVTSRLTEYLTTCAALVPTSFLNHGASAETEREEVLMSSHLPVLSYLYTDVLVSCDGKNAVAVTELGGHRDAVEFHRKLGTMLWQNLQQLSDVDYDYLHSEIKYLQLSFKNFLNDLAMSLDVSADTDVLLLDECVRKIEDVYATSPRKDVADAHNDKTTLTNLLKVCSREVSSLVDDVCPESKINAVGNSYVLMSYVKALLNSKLPSVDPLTKLALKRRYVIEERGSFECLKRSYELLNDVYSNTTKTLSPLCKALDWKIAGLAEKNREFEQYVAVRPDSVRYDSVLKEINYGFSTLLSAKKIVSLYNEINCCVGLIEDVLLGRSEDADLSRCRSCLSLTKSVEYSLESFLKILKAHRHSYPDVVEPVLGNVTELSYGLKLKSGLLKKLQLQCENTLDGIELHESIIGLVKFPVFDEKRPTFMDTIDLYMRESFQNYVTKRLEDEEPSGLAGREKFSLLKCGIIEACNSCVVDAKYSHALNEELFGYFDKLMGIFVTAWNKQEAEREVKLRESESLYKIRKRCENLTDDQIVEEDFKSLFPDHHGQDFADLRASTLDDEVEDASEIVADYVGLITAEEVGFVCDLHTEFVRAFTESEWLQPSKGNLTCDYVGPLMRKFSLLKLLLKKSVHCLNYTMDAEIIGSLSVLACVAKKFGDCTLLDDANASSPSGFTNKRRYNFYADPNVEEVASSHPLLEELQLRVSQLLNEWPDHPTLQNIDSIIRRICDFDVTSPVSRFLTGFEILLTKCNEWEQNAHAGVSLQSQTQNLTRQIIAWRKIELNMWKDSLSNAFDRMNEPVSKWWIALYDVIRQYTREDKFTADEVTETLQKFVTQSNLAEFAGRLALLYAFHCHCVQLPTKTNKTEILTNLLWNLHQYYVQFVATVNAKIKELRSPIEKKLKDYVKIVRWKDISYWAVKETLDKTHRTVHKYMREFEDVLKQPVLPFLTNTTTSAGDFKNVGIWDRPQRASPKTYHYSMDAVTYMARQSLSKKLAVDQGVAEEAFLPKSGRYFNKARLLCKETVSSAKYPALIQVLDGFVGEVIETSTSLQNQEVDKTLPMDKQKSQAKSVLNQKRRALADLFKTMSKLGLSYRSGIVESKRKENTSDFLLKPLDLRASLNHLSHRLNDKKLLTIWDGCEMYYAKSLMRLDVLNSALTNPAKDLGLHNVERCKGFAANLMTLGHQQKSKLIESTRNLYRLRYYATYFTEFCEETSFLHATAYKRLTKFFKMVVITAEQYKIILASCPEEVAIEGGTEGVPVLKPKSPKAIRHKNDVVWTEAWRCVTGAMGAGEKALALLGKSKIFVPFIGGCLIRPTYLPIAELDSVKTTLATIHAYLNDLLEIFGNIPLANGLKWLLTTSAEVAARLGESPDDSSSVRRDDFIHDNEKLIKTMLLSIQSVYKKYKTTSFTEKVEDPPVEAEDDDVLNDQHLKLLIVSNLTDDLAKLSVDRILTDACVVAEKLKDVNPLRNKDFSNVLSHTLPLLEQLTLLYEYFVTQQVSAYRVTCKMSSVVFNVFIELATKGFCVPPEFSGELEGEGETRQSGGMGLGEGEGEKDVSERIESEDQLDDAKPAGSEKQQDDDKECGEEDKGVEMSEDFDGKLQDVGEKPERDEEDSSNSDAEEQMGETEEGSDQLDQQVWGSDEEEESGDDEDKEEQEGEGKKGRKEGEQQVTAKEGEADANDDDDEADGNEKDGREKSKQEINEMEDPEYDDEQVDPYHGNQQEQPEPEPMDLPEDMRLDDDEKGNDESQDDENPFDIDTMKEQAPPKEDKTQENEPMDVDDGKEEKEESASEISDDEQAKENEEQIEGDDGKEEEGGDRKYVAEEQEEETVRPGEQSASDRNETSNEEAQAMDVDKAEAVDKVQDSNSKNQESSKLNDDVHQEDAPDKDGVGQSQMEKSQTGHKGQANAQQEAQDGGDDERQQAKRQRPGDSDSQRSLGDVSQPVRKKLKTIDAAEEQEAEGEDADGDDGENNAEMYQHIKDAKSAREQVLDVATEEQVEQQKDVSNLQEDAEEKRAEGAETLPEDEEEMDVDVGDVAKMKANKLDYEKAKTTEKAQHPDGDVTDDVKDVEVEGDLIKTATVPRGGESTHHTQYESFAETTPSSKMSADDINKLRAEVEQQLSVWNESPTSDEAKHAWEKISSVTLSLAQDLSEQLRLVLEPTQASRLKGDFRTGRRINMRKVIPYVASQFRKDKIWLRRTRPSKRDYQIVLAIDDSSSMADNHSKELAFESVALISKALSLLESGQLSVLSFGETTEVLHKLTDAFTEGSGSKLLQKFQFAQKKTCVARLVDFATEMLVAAHSRTHALNAKLLVIVSDGRGVFSEGESYVQRAVRRAKLSGVFMIFVIVDNPRNASSVLDIRMPVFSSDGKLLDIKSYMDSFPFPFYIILRDINSLPSVLSDALRQWFEMVSGAE